MATQADITREPGENTATPRRHVRRASYRLGGAAWSIPGLSGSGPDMRSLIVTRALSLPVTDQISLVRLGVVRATELGLSQVTLDSFPSANSEDREARVREVLKALDPTELVT
jgi:hypothetical protein